MHGNMDGPQNGDLDAWTRSTMTSQDVDEDRMQLDISSAGVELCKIITMTYNLQTMLSSLWQWFTKLFSNFIYLWSTLAVTSLSRV